MKLKYNIRQTGDFAILDLNGRLSLGEAVAFGRGSGVVLSETIRELTKKDQKKILLNLAELTYVDSSGVGQPVGAPPTDSQRKRKHSSGRIPVSASTGATDANGSGAAAR